MPGFGGWEERGEGQGPGDGNADQVDFALLLLGAGACLHWPSLIAEVSVVSGGYRANSAGRMAAQEGAL